MRSAPPRDRRLTPILITIMILLRCSRTLIVARLKLAFDRAYDLIEPAFRELKPALSRSGPFGFRHCSRFGLLGAVFD